MAIIIDRNYTCFLFFGLLFISISAINCSSDTDSQSQDLSNITPVEIDSLDLFLNPLDHDLSNPLALEVLSDGSLAVLDSDQKEVLIYQSDGSLDTQFGREGKGPGEFVHPRGLEIQDSTVHIIDTGLQRVNQYDLSGNFIQNYNIKREASFFGFTAIGDSMDYYTVANGLEGKLIGHRNAETDSVRYFGEAVVEDPPPTNDQGSFSSDAGNGEIPEAIRNEITMYYQGGDLYVYLTNLSRLQKYTDGSLEWDKELWMPANDVRLNRFLENASKSGFGVLRYIADLSATDDHIYLLWYATPEHPQTLVQVDTQGKVQTIFNLPDSGNFSSMAIDSNNDRLYLADQRSAEVYTTPLLE